MKEAPPPALTRDLEWKPNPTRTQSTFVHQEEESRGWASPTHATNHATLHLEGNCFQNDPDIDHSDGVVASLTHTTVLPPNSPQPGMRWMYPKPYSTKIPMQTPPLPYLPGSATPIPTPERRIHGAVVMMLLKPQERGKKI